MIPNTASVTSSSGSTYTGHPQRTLSLRDVERISPWYWVEHNGIILPSGPYTIRNHEYIMQPLESKAKKQVDKKGAQMGFALDINTLLLTYGGWKTMEELSVGDKVFAPDGSITNVTFVSDIMENHNCYKVTFNEGTSVVCDEGHLWTVRNLKFDVLKTINTSTLFKKYMAPRGRSRYAVDVTEPLNTPELDLPIDPYTLGLWLGDGNSDYAQITCSEADAWEYTKFIRGGFQLRFDEPRFKGICHIRLDVSFNKKLKNLNLIKNKHIPTEYLLASYEQRLDLLRGLIDTNGSIDFSTGNAIFYNTNISLLFGVFTLMASLGFKPYMRDRGPTVSPTTGNLGKNLHEIRMRVGKDPLVSKLSRKFRNQWSVQRKLEVKRRYVSKVEPVSTRPVRCITVDHPSHCYLVTKAMIATHNSQKEVIRTLHGLINQVYKQGVLYLFPTADDVGEFSKARFNPLINENPKAIGAYLSDTDTATIKKVWKALLYFRGARATSDIEGGKKDSSKLRSIPVDKIVFDECDLMDPKMIDLALERMSHSDVQEEVYLSTPSIPDYGIDRLYQESDQKVWMIKCRHCGEWTCSELEFPELIAQRRDGTGYKQCRKCKQEIYTRDGEWCSQTPGREIEGRWISQLNSAYIDPWKVLQLFLNPPNGNLQEVYNSKLGMAYIAAENRLRAHDLWPLCGIDPMPISHEGPTAMGVDVGNNFHVTILDRPNEQQTRIVKVLEVSSSNMNDFTPLHDIAQQYNVRCAVIDFAPVQQKVRAFREAESFEVFGCIYQEHQRGQASWDVVDGIVRMNRTEICDATHELCMKKGMLIVPRRSPEIETWVKQMCNIAKVLEEDKETGSKEYRYRKLGPDHYRHSLNYAKLAASRIGIYVPAKKTKGYSWRGRDAGSWQTI